MNNISESLKEVVRFLEQSLHGGWYHSRPVLWELSHRADAAMLEKPLKADSCPGCSLPRVPPNFSPAPYITQSQKPADTGVQESQVAGRGQPHCHTAQSKR